MLQFDLISLKTSEVLFIEVVHPYLNSHQQEDHGP